MEERVALEKQAILWIAREEVGEAEHRDARARLRHMAQAEVETMVLEIEEGLLSETAVGGSTRGPMSLLGALSRIMEEKKLCVRQMGS